jgi:hypothetical protein
MTSRCASVPGWWVYSTSSAPGSTSSWARGERARRGEGSRTREGSYGGGWHRALTGSRAGRVLRAREAKSGPRSCTRAVPLGAICTSFVGQPPAADRERAQLVKTLERGFRHFHGTRNDGLVGQWSVIPTQFQ